MTMITTPMRDDHRACDHLLAEAEAALDRGDAAAASTLFADFQQRFEGHLRMEEEVLFPEFESQTGMTAGPTQVMRMEHEELREQARAATGALASGDNETFLDACDTLLTLLQQHNAKEEQVLYPMCDRTLSNPEATWARMQQVDTEC